MGLLNAPRGFVPTRTLRGNCDFRTRLIHQTGQGSAATASIFIGDPVELRSDGQATPVTASSDANETLGVVAAVLNSNRRPLTHSLPTQAAYLEASTEGWLEINDDPDTVYIVQSDVSVTHQDIGAHIRVTAGAPTTAAGRSGYQAGIITASAGDGQFKIIGLSPFEQIHDASAWGGDDTDIEVIIAAHTYRQSSGV